MNDIVRAIIQHIGGKHTFVMVGAKNITYSEEENSLTFKFGRAPGSKANHVRIEYLQGLDLYKVSFIRATMKTFVTTAEYTGIYADGLRGLFERETGLRTSLTATYS